MAIPVFFLVPSDQVQVALRRYRRSEAGPCAAGGSWCDATAVIIPAIAKSEWGEGCTMWHPQAPRDDARWPPACASCGVPFTDDDEWQVRAEGLHSGHPSGDLYTLRDAPAGAMWDATWYDDDPAYTGADGISLIVRTPGGDWSVDSEASNCTRPKDLAHKCWVRHGDPRDPQAVNGGRKLHVDKAGETCSAGAGSIQAGTYHGFLHDGALT